MFNHVNVCKCLMSHLQIEANVRGVHTCCKLWFVSTAQVEPEHGSRSCVIFWKNLQNATCFPRKDVDTYTMYRLLLLKMICAWHDVVVPLAACPRSPHTAPSASHWQTHLERHEIPRIPSPQTSISSKHVKSYAMINLRRPVFIYRHKSKWPNYAIYKYIYIHSTHNHFLVNSEKWY